MIKKFRPIFFPLLSLIIVGLGHPSFIPWIAPLSAALGYALFWREILAENKKRRFWMGAVWFFAVQAIYLSWMTSIEFQGPYILFVYLSLCIFLGIQFGCLCTLLPKKDEITIPKVLALASLWTLIEWGRLFIMCGFSWNPVGMSLSTYLWPLQMASLFGVLGLSFWVLFSNLMALRSVSTGKLKHYGIWLTVVLIPYFFGFIYLNYHQHQREKSEGGVLSIAIVHTGLLPSEKVPLREKLEMFIPIDIQWINILQFLKELKEKPDLIAMPEAVVPSNSGYCIYPLDKVEKIFIGIFGEQAKEAFPPLKAPYADAKTMKASNLFWAQTISNLFHAEVVLGLDHTDFLIKKNYNSVFHLLPCAEEVSRYDKRVLLPLAEYLPFKWLIPFVRAYGINEFFTHGKEAGLFHGKVGLSPSVCYEETFPNYMREGRAGGAEIFVNVTNDGWYPFSGLSKQHLDHARLRAVENGIPLVRACNIGVSALIDSSGKILNKLEELDTHGNLNKGAIEASLSLYRFPTLYQYWGDMALMIPCLFFICLFFLKKYFFKEINNVAGKVGVELTSID